MGDKYAALPDIDTSGADIFETPDVPEQPIYTRDTDSDDDDALTRAHSPTAYRRALAGPSGATPANASDDIDAQRLDPLDARKRFGQATRPRLDRLAQPDSHRRPPARRGPLPSAREYIAHETGRPDLIEGETPLERLRRLRREVVELEDQVRRSEQDDDGELAANRQEEGSADQGGPAIDDMGNTVEPSEKIILQPEQQRQAGHQEGTATNTTKTKRQVSPAIILQQLNMLRGDLTGVASILERRPGGGNDPRLDTELAADANGRGSELAHRVQGSRSLINNLGEAAALAETEAGTAEARPAADIDKSSRGGDSADERTAGAGRDGQLEKRVAELEQALGASGADVSELSPQAGPLLPTLSKLEHLVVLLSQPRHLDSISRRVKVLVSDLERIHDSRRKLGDTRPLNVALQGGMTLSTGSSLTTSTTPSTSTGPNISTPPLGASSSAGGGSTGSSGSTTLLPPDAAQKLAALALLVPRIEPLLPLAPRLLSRLQSLSSLHARAASFGDELASLGASVRTLRDGESGLREVVEGLEGSVKDNEERMKANLDALGQRVEDLVRRLEALESPKTGPAVPA